MEEKQKLKFKKKLTTLKKQLTERIEFIDGQGLGDSLKESISELSTYDNHPADIGSEVFERSKDFSLRESAIITLEAVDEALEKINTGTYGTCEHCGKNIDPGRLEVIPYTTLCLDCKAVEEEIPDQNERPVEEEVLGKPFARTFTDDPEAVGYDGEDAWREVANYSETTDEWSRGGAYYGYSITHPDQDRNGTEDVDNISYRVGADGIFYKDFSGVDDDSAPTERIDPHEE
ncbi:MAG: TraR/DksA C4-type zinc finger protein [Desulfotomaculaceae bacterium]|nr:TraR/DksA C4-type zinc finger protein [Desulfotomaculaceae bacterium]